MRKTILCIVLLALAATLVTPTCVIVKNIKFKQNCSGYLKQAADANTIELAKERLDLAIEYIESHNLTEGYTSVLWRTEDENIGYWYANLKNCQKELEDNFNATSLEQSNVLMKLRESLTDEGEDGTVLTIPTGISRYPNNLMWGIFRWLSLIVFLIICVALSAIENLWWKSKLF